jgi:hypothetical protein
LSRRRVSKSTISTIELNVSGCVKLHHVMYAMFCFSCLYYGLSLATDMAVVENGTMAVSDETAGPISDETAGKISEEADIVGAQIRERA